MRIKNSVKFGVLCDRTSSIYLKVQVNFIWKLYKNSIVKSAYVIHSLHTPTHRITTRRQRKHMYVLLYWWASFAQSNKELNWKNEFIVNSLKLKMSLYSWMVNLFKFTDWECHFIFIFNIILKSLCYHDQQALFDYFRFS